MLLTLCVTEITSWGVLYYAFPVLAPTLARDTGWSVSTVTAAFSGGLVVSGSGRMVAVVGLEDVVVVETGDALLVASRERAQDVKLVVEALKATGRTDLV